MNPLFWVGVLVGALLGASIGAVVMGVFSMGKQCDELIEHDWPREEPGNGKKAAGF